MMRNSAKPKLPECTKYLTCLFCLNQCIEPRQGKTRCPLCHAVFEIDVRVECVFANTDNIRLPVNGVVCGSCGLVQGENRKNCMYCGIAVNTAVH